MQYVSSMNRRSAPTFQMKQNHCSSWSQQVDCTYPHCRVVIQKKLKKVTSIYCHEVIKEKDSLLVTLDSNVLWIAVGAKINPPKAGRQLLLSTVSSTLNFGTLTLLICKVKMYEIYSVYLSY